jgi:hypothetical protein
MTKTKTKTNSTLRILPVVLIVLVSGTGISTDKSFIDDLKERLIQYNSDYPMEKTYLMTDRYVYRPGEDLWFKGFIAPSGRQQPQFYSQDFFIKLLNSRGEEIIYRRYPVTNNQTAGRLLIPRSSIPGKYWLVAYTGWMKNRCSQEAFRKEILISKYFDKRFQVEVLYDKIAYYPHDTLKANVRILDAVSKPITEVNFDYTIGSFAKQHLKGTGKTDTRGFSTITGIIPNAEEILILTIEIRSRKLSGDYALIIPSIACDPVISFFPEGINLVNGLKNVMAVKAVNNFGLPAVISGEIIDYNGNLLQKISTDARGVAKFDYLPSEDTCYLKVTEPKGILKRYPLPIANGHGFVIHLVETGIDSAKISITSSDDQSLTTSHWVAVMNKQVVWSDFVNFTKSTIVGIPLRNLQSGVMQVSVFNQNHDLMAERLINIQNKSELLSVKTDHQVYHNRQRVNLLVQYPVSLTRVDLALSVSLHDLSYNSLITDFKAIVNSNFCDTNSSYAHNLDLTHDLDMITTNYRNVYWNDVLANTNVKQPYVRNDGLSGKVFDKKENLSQHAKVRVTHIPNYRSYETQSDENGEFKIVFGSDIIDYNYLNIDAYDALGKVNLRAIVDQSYVDDLSAGLIEELENNEQRKAIDVLTYGEPDLVYVLRYGPGKFRKSIVETKKKYDPNQYADYINVLDIIQDIKPYRLNGDAILFINDDENNLETRNQEGAIIVINGALKGNNVGVLKNLLPSDITNINISTSLIDIHKYTTLNFVAVIEITTIQGLYRYRQPAFQKGMDILNTNRQFYSPDYSIESTNIGDNRKTLYWNPKLMLNPGAPMLVSFYTSDVKGMYYGHLVGIDSAGNPVESEFTFMVE